MVNNLLIVEDDADLRMILADVLADEGFEVITASDGVEAQEVLLRLGNSIGCVLLDWNMPRMTGIELLEWMKTDTRWNGIPVVFLTGATDPGQIRRGIEAGAFYYLTKPALPTVVLSIIRSAVDDRRYKERLHELLATCQNPLGLLLEGSFEFRSIRDAERLATIIANASPEPQRALVINEIFVNAVEHGNLGISYEEKGALLEAGTWYDEVERRLKLPEHSGKSVRVGVRRDDEGMHILVRDSGPGFDFGKYLNFDADRVFHTHGRGIAMARAALNLSYEDGGRAVRITIAKSQA